MVDMKKEEIKLYPHQKAVLENTKHLNKVGYILDMGLGKTFVASEKLNDLNAKLNLIVCQKSQVDYWCEHMEKYYDFIVYDLTNKEDYGLFTHLGTTDNRIVAVINYDLIWRRTELLKLKDFTLLLDESSLIQNETSKRAKFILKLKPVNVILSTGTIVGGKYEKAWSQMKLLGWDISKKLYWNQFVRTRKLSHLGRAVNIVIGYKNVERLKAKMREYGCQFLTTEEVFDLPQQLFTKIPVTRTKDYDRFKKHKIIIKNDIAFVGDTALTNMLYQRVLCGAFNDYKKQAFEDIISSTSKRVIVFYNFNDELRTIEDVCVKLNKPLSIVNGSHKDLSMYEECDDSITAIQYQAGAMGLNLQKANTIIYYTPTLSSELYEQSKKRIHRIGQTKTCFYYNLVVKGSIEEKIYKVLDQRKDFTERLFENGQ